VSDASSEASSDPARNPLRRLYEWVLSLADSPFGVGALFLLALAESSFFPIPPDVLLIALALGTPPASFRFAAWCTLGSVVGGVVGYYIGVMAWKVVQPMMIPAIFSQEKFDQVTGLYDEWGVMIVFVAAFTPIPYKVFTIAAGVFGLNLPAFVAASTVGRGARFFLVAALVRRYGEEARAFIDRHFNKLTLVFSVLLVGGFALLKMH
jgi:membrane protein YqaA with SNARE-associated domain